MDHADSLVSLALGILTIMGVVFSWLRWIRPRIKRVKRDLIAFRDTFLGREEVVDSITGEVISPAIPPIGSRMAQQEAQNEYIIGKIHEIEHEVKPNNGTSMKDSVNRIEKRLESGDIRFENIETKLEEHIEEGIIIVGEQYELELDMDSAEDIEVFEGDPDETLKSKDGVQDDMEEENA